MLAQRHELARLKSDFYRDKFRKILRWLTLSVLLMFLLIAVIIYLILFQPQQHYYGNTSEGKIINMPRRM